MKVPNKTVKWLLLDILYYSSQGVARVVQYICKNWLKKAMQYAVNQQTIMFEDYMQARFNKEQCEAPSQSEH